jgi:hypothetical protein
MLVHIQSTLQATFGRVDGNGDVVEQFPFQLTILTLNEESFQEALKKILEVRQKLRDKLSSQNNGEKESGEFSLKNKLFS